MLVPQSPAPAGAPTPLPYQSPYEYQQPTIPARLLPSKQPFEVSDGGMSGPIAPDLQPTPAAATTKSRARKSTTTARPGPSVSGARER